MTTTQTVSIAADTLAGKYLDAWQAHNVDAIIALHTPDTVFTSVATGTEAIGREAVREAIIGIFAVWPDMHFHPHFVHTTPDLMLAESTLKVTQAVPLPLGDTVVEPNGKTIAFPIADILELDNGLVKRKSTYFDALGYVRQMRATTP